MLVSTAGGAGEPSDAVDTVATAGQPVARVNRWCNRRTPGALERCAAIAPAVAQVPVFESFVSSDEDWPHCCVSVARPRCLPLANVPDLLTLRPADEFDAQRPSIASVNMQAGQFEQPRNGPYFPAFGCSQPLHRGQP